jgi:hypothetical protein
MPGPTVADAGDHVLGRIMVVRGAKALGSPVGALASTVSSGSAHTVPSVTVPRPDCLVACFVARFNDSSSAFVNDSSWNNFPPVALTERSDEGSTTGNGGALAVATGVVSTAQESGSWTLNTSTSTAVAVLVLVIEPVFDDPAAFFAWF